MYSELYKKKLGKKLCWCKMETLLGLCEAACNNCESGAR